MRLLTDVSITCFVLALFPSTCFFSFRIASLRCVTTEQCCLYYSCIPLLTTAFLQPNVRIAKLIQSKIPEIEKSLKLVTFLKAKEAASETTLTTRYNLADMLYSKASIDCASGIVNLWLGANVMLEYTYDEAIDLLSTKLTKANKDLEDTTEDLALIRNQIITSEVNISRIYNWDVKKKREDRK